MDRRITFFHSPNTRSSDILALLRELGADYALKVLDMKAGEQRGPAYLAINPMGKVPAIMHGETLITEQPAIVIYLGDLYPESGLAPQMGDPLRGAYLRWLVFYGSSYEPALVDRAAKHEAPSRGMSPYGDFDTMLATLVAQLEKGPWLLGERFTAADVLWGSAVGWTLQFGLVPDLPVLRAYAERVKARPALAWAREQDAELMARFEARQAL